MRSFLLKKRQPPNRIDVFHAKCYNALVDDEEEYLRRIPREGGSPAERLPGNRAEKVAFEAGK